MTNPMYRQIAEDLREQIESGRRQPGQQLRTVLELRERYGASPFYPWGLAVQRAEDLLLADDIEQGAVQYLAETLGLKQRGYRDWITVPRQMPRKQNS